MESKESNEDGDKDDDVAGDGSDTTVLYTLHQTVDWTNAGFYGPHIRVWWSIPVICPLKAAQIFINL